MLGLERLETNLLLVRPGARTLYPGFYFLPFDEDGTDCAFVGIGFSAWETIAIIDPVEGFEKLLPPPGVPIRLSLTHPQYFLPR